DGVSGNSFNPSVGAGEYTITYTVADVQPCVTGNDTTTFTITVQDAQVNASVSRTLCVTQAQDLISNTPEGISFLQGLIEETGVDDFEVGNFDDNAIIEISNLANFIASPTDDSQEFNFQYSESSELDCGVLIIINLTINNIQDAEAGELADQTVCSDLGLINLTDFLTADTSTGGTFSGDNVVDGMFDSSVGPNDNGYQITYSVDGSADCVTDGTSDTATFIITVDDPQAANAGDIADQIVCSNAGMINLTDFLTADTSTGGTFSGDNVVDGMFDSSVGPNDNGFQITYSVDGSADCVTNGTSDTATFTITVNNLQAANAGDITDQIVCSDAGIINLADFLTADTSTGGTFSGDNVANGMFDSSVGPNDNGYQITYSVDGSASCVTDGTSDSTTFTIFVNQGVSAGADNNIEVCRGEVDSFNESDAREFYLDLLEAGVSNDGTFNPTIADLVADYNNNEDQTIFATTYTVSNDNCSDSALLTVNIPKRIPAEIGNIANPDPICRNAEDVDLFSYLPEGANLNGTFEGYEDGTFSPTMMGEGDFEITYTLTDDSPCTTGEASATFTITVQDAAFAGMDMDIAVCQNDGVQNLFDFLSVDADTNGEFTLEDGTVVTDGMMDPSAFDAGTYTVTYTVAAINDCGDASAEFTITVQQVGDAPVVGDATFCAVLDPTGADLTAGSEDLTFYTDADLTMMVADDAPLTEGTYYVTQRGDAGCESAATTLEVSITDPGTPTIEDANQTFCQFDDPTIADLNDAIDQTSNVTWYASADSTDPLSTGTALQDGVTYFASLYDPASDCDSSERLAVNVSLECDFFIPEGISPNGDQLNDDFEIRYIEDFYPNYTIEIYNRWGDSVYKGNANTPNWDGTSNQGSFGDGLLPVGVYFYYLDFKDGSTEPRRGKVYLSR
ncbi:gliding motility-associated C-terminal domain-containing protein, partial [uncultured Christiangramia sp.]|uniref:gliding motility-associated C-terminal domain-containing protein n=1 Tax=uncultured Christiangramia sp. TaxID=503836 RepID=UPI00260870FF